MSPTKDLIEEMEEILVSIAIFIDLLSIIHILWNVDYITVPLQIFACLIIIISVSLSNIPYVFCDYVSIKERLVISFIIVAVFCSACTLFDIIIASQALLLLFLPPLIFPLCRSKWLDSYIHHRIVAYQSGIEKCDSSLVEVDKSKPLFLRKRDAILIWVQKLPIQLQKQEYKLRIFYWKKLAKPFLLIFASVWGVAFVMFLSGSLFFQQLGGYVLVLSILIFTKKKIKGKSSLSQSIKTAQSIVTLPLRVIGSYSPLQAWERRKDICCVFCGIFILSLSSLLLLIGAVRNGISVILVSHGFGLGMYFYYFPWKRLRRDGIAI